MMYYRAYRIVDRKPRWIIVDKNGMIINNDPNREELKGLEKFHELDGRCKNGSYIKYTDEELLDYLRKFENKGMIPTEEDFVNNPGYPGFSTYQRRFGSWSNALRLAGFDIESMIKKGVLTNNNQKARLAEMIIRDHFKKNPIDLSGENGNSPCDGICPNGKTYDVKGSKLRKGYYLFNILNKYKEEIEIYYFLAFNEDWTELNHAWRVPGEIIEKDYFQVGIAWAEFTIDNMMEYSITDKLKGVLKIYGCIKD